MTLNARNLAVMLLTLGLMLLPMLGVDAYAAEKPNIPMPVGTCTTDGSFDINSSTMMQNVTQKIQGAISELASKTFGSLAGHVGNSVSALLAIYVIVYGVLFITGGVSHSAYEASVRIAKGAFVALAIKGGSGGVIYNTMQDIFEVGGANILSSLGASVNNVDAIAAKIVSAKMIITVIAALTTGPYGFILGGLIVLSLKSIIEAILNAAWIYLMAMVVRALLYGLAPIFIPCVLFSRTRHMFDGWLNQLVNAALQPIFLFAFLSFFMTLVGSLVDEILETPVCWSPMNDVAKGAPMMIFGWKFTVAPTGVPEIFSGRWGSSGPIGPDGSIVGPVYPIEILNILLFFVLAELLGRFNSIVLSIASGIAGAGSTSISSMGNVFSSWDKNQNQPPPESKNAQQHSSQAKQDAKAAVGKR